jgi:hypothetical protein
MKYRNMSDYDLKASLERATKQQTSLYETKCPHTDIGTNIELGRRGILR